jgi:alpha-beta hydrolase superfamily lysophospholipase
MHPETSRVREEAVWFPNLRGRRLAAVFGRPENGAPKALVVLCHGMLSGKNSPKHQSLAHRLSSRGIASLRFDFTSRYDSEGPVEEMTYTNQVGDLAGAVDCARKTFGPLPLGLYGSSMGGAVAILYTATHEPPDALATISAVGRPGALWSAWGEGERLERWRLEGWITLEGTRLPYSFYQDSLKQDVPGAASRIRCPFLLVHGARDSIVPVVQCRELHAAAAGPKRIVILPEADHRFSRPEDLERMLQEVSDWFFAHLLQR